MCRQGVVYCVGKDIEAVVEEEDDKEDYEQECTKLEACTNLQDFRVIHKSNICTYDPSRHLSTCGDARVLNVFRLLLLKELRENLGS